MQEIRQNYCFPSIVQHFRILVKESQTCIQVRKIDNSQLTREFISIPELHLGPEDVIHIGLLPELLASVGYENIITANDVFSR